MMSNFAEQAKVRDAMRQDAKSRMNSGSKDRLNGIVDKKFRTCYVFALSEFELAFGHLWGHGLDEDSLDDSQIICRRKWIQARANILNKGNTQSRAVQAEIALHKVEWTGYRMDIKSPGMEEDDGRTEENSRNCE